MSPRGNFSELPANAYRTATNVSWRGFVTDPAFSKSITRWVAPSPGRPPSACARRPCTWVGAVRRLLHRNRRREMGGTRIPRLSCSLSQVYLIPRARLRPNTRRGRIATFLTGQKWTCCRGWKIRLSASLLDSASAFWRGGSFLQRSLNLWTPTWWAVTSEAARWIFAKLYFGRHAEATRPRHETYTSVLHQPHLGAACTGCAVITLPRWRSRDSAA